MTDRKGRDKLDDKRIIDLYFDRDERAIEESCIKYGAYCGRVAINILSDPYETEECLNDTWLRAWNTIPPTIPDILRSFFARITRNLAIDRVRKRQADKRLSGEYLCSLDELSECVSGEPTSLEPEEIGRIISDFLSEEKAECRRIFVLRYFYSESLVSIAKRCGESVGKIKSTLFRMRARLKERLIREEVYL